MAPATRTEQLHEHMRRIHGLIDPEGEARFQGYGEAEQGAIELHEILHDDPADERDTHPVDDLGPYDHEYFDRTFERLRNQHGRAAGNVFTGIYLGERRDV